jgi:hypothetical protein
LADANSFNGKPKAPVLSQTTLLNADAFGLPLNEGIQILAPTRSNEAALSH